VHVRDAEPFDPEGFPVAGKIMREADGIETARNRKQQALEPMTAEIFVDT